MINGSAISLAIIAAILLTLSLLNRCDNNSSEPVQTAVSPIDTDAIENDTLTAGRRAGKVAGSSERSPERNRRSRRPTGRQPQIPPERSPLDQPVGVNRTTDR